MLARIATQGRAIAALLAKSSGTSGDPLYSLLVGGEDGVAAQGARLPGAKGAAALEVFRRQLEANPKAFTALIRGNARRALAATDDETDPRVNSMREFLSRAGPLGDKARGVA